MNEGHMSFCTSAEWRAIVEDLILPGVLAGVDLGDDVLEIGPGAGFTTDVLRASAARVTAVEIDPALAAPLAERMAGTNVTVLVGDAAALGLPDGGFSGVASFHMLHHVPDDDLQDRVFAELARVLRPGGTLVAADGVADEATRAFHADDVYHPIDPATLEVRLAGAGFDQVRVGRHDMGWFCAARRATP